MADPDETFRRVIEAAQQSYAATERLWAPVLPEATRRLLHDALLRVRTRSTAELIRRDHQGAFAGGWTDRDQHLAEWAAAVALVIAEHPELITGTPTDRRPASQVVAGVVAPVVTPWGGARLVPQVATAVLQALELAGYEVTVRADRFASLERGVRQIRIPLRGRCRSCGEEVTCGASVSRGELLVGAWAHIDPDASCDLGRGVDTA